MQDCSPKSLRFPDEEIAAMKDYVNDLTGTKFDRAGLGRGMSQSTLLILDTPLLRTTRMLFSRFGHGIKRLIIVECKSNIAERILTAIENEGFRDLPIEVVNAEVIAYLAASTEQIDFIWLDLQCDRFTIAHKIRHHLTYAQCVAMTIAMRSRANGTVASRVNKITRSVKRVLPHLVADFGYKINQDVEHLSAKELPKRENKQTDVKKQRANMHLLVYSKHWSPCDYHIGRDKQGYSYIYGYPMTHRNYKPHAKTSHDGQRKSARLASQTVRATRVSRRRVQF